MNETIKAQGEVNIRVYENDELKSAFVERNLVVTLGKENIAKLLGGAATGKAITQIGVGSSAMPAVVGDAALTTPFTKAIGSVSYPDAQSVLFSFDIANNEANGLTIREFGLLNSDNVLCARKVRTTEIVKTDVIRLVGTWKITIN